jgi:hypothetical protein
MRAAVILLAAMLGGCQHMDNRPATMKALCEEVFTDPGYAVKGKTRRDQFWIDSQLESGYASCGWPRPGKSSAGRADTWRGAR